MSIPDPDTCYRAVHSRDSRFDGWFFTAVRTTGIYCRPSCPAMTPLRKNVEFHPSAAAAQRAGFRACKRCRPDASPGSPDWDVRGDLSGRALRLIGDGVIDRAGVGGLARTLGYSQRQVHRSLVEQVGAGPLALARAQRAQTARVLLETSTMSSADVAFAAGFASVRQFNETMRDIFATTPTELRAQGNRADPATPGELHLRLPYREPMNLGQTLRFLGLRAINGVEDYDGQTYTRTLRLPAGAAQVHLQAGSGPFLDCRLRLSDQRDLTSAVARIRRLLDLDADPVAVDEVLAGVAELRTSVRLRPGLRSPGAVDGFEMGVRAILGQQISVAAAGTLLGRITRELGDRPQPDEPWRLFPTPQALLTVPQLKLPMPATRVASLVALARAIDSGEVVLDPGADRAGTRAALLALPGIGPWTADYLVMRALGHPDVLLDSDLGIRRAGASLGLDLAEVGSRLSPWRSYATHHLWATLHPEPSNGET
jgi:AraC family transcriptional regulator of adaptative response / DNA-3-methyladenine glycosylase II